MNNTNVDDSNVQVIVENKIDNSNQLLDAGEADWDNCPQCDSENVDYGECDPDTVFVYRIHTCQDCGTKWEERYDLVKIRIFNDE